MNSNYSQPQQMGIKPFSVIVACSRNEGIGLRGDLPWPKIPKEMKHFVNVTQSKEPLAFTLGEQAVKSSGLFFQSKLTPKVPHSQVGIEKVNAVIMGRKTWESIPLKFRPLAKRLNVVLSTQQNLEDANDENGLVQVHSDFEKALQTVSADPRVNEIFVIGGATIYD